MELLVVGVGLGFLLALGVAGLLLWALQSRRDTRWPPPGPPLQLTSIGAVARYSLRRKCREPADPVNLVVRAKLPAEVAAVLDRRGWGRPRWLAANQWLPSDQGECVGVAEQRVDGPLWDRNHVRLWLAELGQARSTIVAAHHEYGITLGADGPLHHPSSFESGLESLVDALQPAFRRGDDIELLNGRRIPFASGRAVTME